MTTEEAGGKTSLTLEEISTEARLLAAEQAFEPMAKRFLSVLHSWAAPSAVLCFSKDAAAEGGWRSLPELTLGPVSPAFERSIVKLIEDSPPGSLSRPVPVRPRDDMPGAKVRDNWLVPWAHGDAYGYLFVRGIARSLPGFGDAVSMVAQSLWPRVPGLAAGQKNGRGAAPAGAQPLSVLVDEAQRMSEGLVKAIREERERISTQAEELSRRVTELESHLVEADKAKTEVESELARARSEIAALKAAPAAPSDEAEGLKKQVAELTEKLAAAEKGKAGAESAHEVALAEVAGLKMRVDSLEALAKARAGAAPEQLESLTAQVGELTEKLAAAEKSKAGAESERDQARSELAGLKSQVEASEAQAKAAAPKDEVEPLKREVAELTEKLAAADKAKADGEAGREAALAESAALKAQLLALESQPKAEPAAAPDRSVSELGEKLAAVEAEREALRNELMAEKARADGLTQQLTADHTWEPTAAEDTDQLQKQLSEIDTKLRTAERERDEAREASQSQKTRADEATSASEAAERTLAERTTELEAARRELAASTQGQGGTEADLSRAKAEAARLWQTVESLQRQLQGEAERIAELGNEKERLSASLAQAQNDREAAQASLLAANEGLQDAEARAKQLGERWQKAVESFRATSEAVRRTPFVPPTLRVAVSGAEEVLAAEGAVEAAKTGGRGPRVLFLDRDTAGIERLAGELEAAGVEVLVAHYPEEVSFFLKTPDARRLTAMACDVMAFRGDQNILEILRGWRQDSPSLSLLLSFKADNPTETEKAQRVPVILTAGYLTRPVDRQAVLDAVLMVARRQGGR